MPVSSHFYSKNVFTCVTCDSGISLVEEMLHIVKENKLFWAGVPSLVSLHCFGTVYGTLSAPLALSILSLIGDINTFHSSFVHLC